jgi:hydroxypyruvate isomerase
MMFAELSFLDRFDAAADAGFEAVEFLFPYDYPPESIHKLLGRNRLELALFNLPPGDWTAGERGLASLPDRFDDFKEGVQRALVYAEATGTQRIHMMAGNAPRTDARAAASFRRALLYAVEQMSGPHIDLLIEPINSRSMPGYFLDNFDYAAELIRELRLPNLRLQFDVYHRQILHGDVTMAFRALLPIIGHVQIASVPSRHEPDEEELNYPFIFDEIDRCGYTGFVGCEYIPRGKTVAGLEWFSGYRRA